MGLSNDLISQFVKVTKDDKKVNKETITYGTIVTDVTKQGQLFVELYGQTTIDNNPIKTPIVPTAGIKEGDKVLVMIKNHTAFVIGNLDDPSATSSGIKGVEDTANQAAARVAEYDLIVADKVSTEVFTSEIARIDTLVSEKLDAKVADITYATIELLNAEIGKVGNLETESLLTRTVKANEGEIKILDTNKLDAAYASANYATISTLESGYATITSLNAANAEIETLYGNTAIIGDRLSAAEATIESLNASSLEATYANIDFSNIGKAAIENFYSTSGLIQDVIFNNGTVTGRLSGVTINGDLIEGNTIVADKLVIKGEDGLFYELNTNGVDITGAQTDYNSINGTLIQAKSITAEHISVSDLVAFGATIGGFHITSSAIYSGVKTSVGSTNAGTYMDKDGQLAIGSGGNYIKYYRTDSGEYKLLVSASNLYMGSSNTKQDVETAINNADTKATSAKTAIDSLSVGGRNLIPDTDFGGASKRVERPEGGATELGFRFTPTVQVESAVEYTISARIRGKANINLYQLNTGGNKSVPLAYKHTLSETEYKLLTKTFTVESGKTLNQVFLCTAYGELNTLVGDWFEIEPKSLKLERGNRATDWTPAPEDVDANISSAKDTAQAALAAANQNAESMASIVTNFNKDIDSLQTQIDGSITSWFYEVAPTSTNEPAGNWTTTDSKNVHLGDLYYDTITGYCYRWQVQNNEYSWQRITDTDVTKALADAQTAKDTADQKRRVFYDQPVPPYDQGDLWVQGTGGDILRCMVSKPALMWFNEGDWVKASKYTDDTKANAANTAAANAQSTANQAATAAANAQASVNNLSVGGRNYLVGSEAEQYTNAETKAEFLKTTFDLAPFFDENGLIQVTLSFDAYSPVAGDMMVYCQNGSGSRYTFSVHFNITTEWKRYSFTFTPSGPYEDFVESYLAFYGTYDTGVIPHVRRLKLEKGNKATDWTLAPEEVATTEEVDDVREKTHELDEELVSAKSLIQQLSDSISMLVTDGNGTSLMTQTAEGWTFSTSTLQSAINRTSDDLTELTDQVGNVDSTVDLLVQAMNDFETMANYIKIGVYEDEPCIELGEVDSDFKLLITNTRILFKEGSNTPAYFNNQSMHIKKAVIEEELQQGGFVWKVRSNGNMGLVWKGGAS